jgi:hypothetical protein
MIVVSSSSLVLILIVLMVRFCPYHVECLSGLGRQRSQASEYDAYDTKRTYDVYETKRTPLLLLRFLFPPDTED